nr:transmembrane 9 superfamily member 3 [Quercus suber]
MLSRNISCGGTCNDLVCLVDDFDCYSHNFILWNPCVRKFVQLPKPNIEFPKHLTFIASFRFGFDTKTDDYKVVRIMTFRDRDNLGIGESPPYVEVGVEVYSPATGEWKTLTAVPPTGTEFYGHPHSFINRALHWVAFRRTKDNMFLEFVSVLNLKDEVFREIALPKLGINGNKLPTFISTYGNSLALFQKVSMDPLSIWLMEEEWKKKKDIEVAYKRRLSKDDVAHFRNAMQKDYYFQMYYDDMPIWGFIRKVEKEGKVDPSEYKYFLFKYIQINVSYNKDRVIEIVAHMDPQSLVDLTKDKEVEVEFMYTVKWKETEIAFEKRMEKYS